MLDPESIYRIKTGDFAGHEAVFVSDSNGLVTFNTQIFGRNIPHTFPLDEIDLHVELFGDVPAIQQSVSMPLGELDLHSLHKNANEVYHAHLTGSESLFSTIQISFSTSMVRVAVRKLNMTWPISTSSGHRVTIDRTIDRSIWNDFRSIIDRIGFWNMPYDDGVRIPSREKPKQCRLLGWRNKQSHEVIRQALNDCPVSEACRFLAHLDPTEQYIT